MKLSNRATLTFCSLFAFAATASSSDIPRGNISASAQVVKSGSNNLTLDWNITYPQTVIDWVDINDDGSITCKSSVNMQVRNLAADVQSRSTYWNGWREVARYSYVNVNCYGKVSNQNWKHLFNGTQPQVDPNSLLWNKNLSEDDRVIFAARASYQGLSWWYSGESSKNVLILRRGDTPPSYSTWTSQSTLGEHIDSYVDDDGRIDIGPRDVIVAFELTHDIVEEEKLDEDKRKGDMQDMILLLTFQKD